MRQQRLRFHRRSFVCADRFSPHWPLLCRIASASRFTDRSALPRRRCSATVAFMRNSYVYVFTDSAFAADRFVNGAGDYAPTFTFTGVFSLRQCFPHGCRLLAVVALRSPTGRRRQAYTVVGQHRVTLRFTDALLAATVSPTVGIMPPLWAFTFSTRLPAADGVSPHGGLYAPCRVYVTTRFRPTRCFADGRLHYATQLHVHDRSSDRFPIRLVVTSHSSTPPRLASPPTGLLARWPLCPCYAHVFTDFATADRCRRTAYYTVTLHVSRPRFHR